MLKIRDDVDLKKLEQFDFQKIQQDKRINYIYTPLQNQEIEKKEEDKNLERNVEGVNKI